MKWFRNKEMLQNILKRNNNELQKYKNDKIVALLKDESNLIKDHLELLDEIEKLNKVIEILKPYILVASDVDFDTFLTSNYQDEDAELVKEMIFGELTKP